MDIKEILDRIDLYLSMDGYNLDNKTLKHVEGFYEIEEVREVYKIQGIHGEELLKVIDPRDGEPIFYNLEEKLKRIGYGPWFEISDENCDLVREHWLPLAKEEIKENTMNEISDETIEKVHNKRIEDVQKARANKLRLQARLMDKDIDLAQYGSMDEVPEDDKEDVQNLVDASKDSLDKDMKLVRHNQLAQRRKNAPLMEEQTDISLIETIANLVGIGFDKLSCYKPSHVRYVKMIMDRAIELGIVIPYDFGRGKGKYTCVKGQTIDSVKEAMKKDDVAKEIAQKYIAKFLKPEYEANIVESLKEDCKEQGEIVATYKDEEGNKHEIIRNEDGKYCNKYEIKDGKATTTTQCVSSLPIAVDALKKKYPNAEEIKKEEINEDKKDKKYYAIYVDGILILVIAGIYRMLLGKYKKKYPGHKVIISSILEPEYHELKAKLDKEPKPEIKELPQEKPEMPEVPPMGEPMQESLNKIQKLQEAVLATQDEIDKRINELQKKLDYIQIQKEQHPEDESLNIEEDEVLKVIKLLQNL